ncbi:MAG: hypothetical protein KatS3mg042_1576 [Rhodothermaceae bacterium]|nr:MAG: hypothetical protein KatS3mg042_1576 [Rhodothermaceae bacterium]
MFALLHIILLCSFVGVTLALLLVHAASRRRVEPVQLCWATGRWAGVPPAPLAFMACVALLMLGTQWTGHTLPAWIFAGYLMGGTFWLAGAWLAGEVLVTDGGLVAPTGRTRCAMAWADVCDYFETERNGCRYVVFFYVDARGRRRRLDVRVPASRYEPFRHIVRTRIDTRMERSLQQTYGKKALEG